MAHHSASSTQINFFYNNFPDLQDAFKAGDGVGGSEIKIENQKNRMKCLVACYERKLNGNSGINGVTYGKLSKYCYHSFYMCCKTTKQ